MRSAAVGAEAVTELFQRYGDITYSIHRSALQQGRGAGGCRDRSEFKNRTEHPIRLGLSCGCVKNQKAKRERFVFEHIRTIEIILQPAGQAQASAQAQGAPQGQGHSHTQGLDLCVSQHPRKPDHLHTSSNFTTTSTCVLLLHIQFTTHSPRRVLLHHLQRPPSPRLRAHLRVSSDGQLHTCITLHHAHTCQGRGLG